MRVITGTARGRRLVAPVGLDVRPTTDKVKEAVFSALQFRLDGADVLDLFAGSGQMGIEALSRGAASAVFVDSSQKAVNCVAGNLRSAGMTDLAQVIKRDSYDYIKLTARSFDLIILDPPYRQGHIGKLLPLAAKKLREDGIIVCEYESEMPPPEPVEGLILRKNYRYGKIAITIFCSSSGEVQS